MQEALQGLIQHHFNLEGKLSPLPGYDDLNFKLDSKNGSTYVVKLMNSKEESSAISFQCALLKHLEQKEVKLHFPKVIRSKSNKDFEIVSINDEQRILWVLTWCPGSILGTFKPQSNELTFSHGEAVAKMTNALEDFSHPNSKTNHNWLFTEALQNRPYAKYVKETTQAIVVNVFDDFEQKILPQLSDLPYSVTQNDANENNTLADYDEKGKAKIVGIFDFGDSGYQPTISEAAIAMAYGIMPFEKPLRACFHFLKGYSKHRSISESELDVLFHLIKTRLAISIANSSYRDTIEDNPYIAISQASAIATLHRLNEIPDALALSFFRVACGYPPCRNTAAIYNFLEANGSNAHPAMKLDRAQSILDLGVGSLLLGADPKSTRLKGLAKKINAYLLEQETEIGIGRYCEARRLYGAANFGLSGHPTQEKRNIHLGIDIFDKAGTSVFAPLDGTVVIQTIIDLPLDYGGVLFLKHQTNEGIPFYTLYGHLAHKSLTLNVGDQVKAGEKIAKLGEPNENGGWPPHLHFQIITNLLGLGQDFPGVAFHSEIDIWKKVCPNPMLLFDVPDPSIYDATVPYESILEERKQRIGYNLSLTYDQPLHMVSGYRQFLFDSYANTYLDFYNNVPHVGHQHPGVVKAIQSQVGLLNTNTRYLHQNILEYARRLTEKLPASLEVCYIVNSATEANELAIRLARNYTKRKDIMVVESAYHGHTNTLIDISPYKHNGPGGKGAPDWVHTIPIADDYRGQWKRDNLEAGKEYANEVHSKLIQIQQKNKAVAALIAETYPSVGGQIIPPKGYLKEVHQHLKNHGALYIADEVQTGFGRLGKSFWAFESQDVVPDIVVLGKPIGNGFPLGAVITTRAIAKAFDNGMEYFSTFGGNPVACAAGLAVLEVMEKEDLQGNAEMLGNIILKELNYLKEKHQLIGDVRGEGLYLGIELVRDRITLEPADNEANYVINRLKDFNILAGTDGPYHNVLKIRPSMVSTEADVSYFIDCLEIILDETFLK